MLFFIEKIKDKYILFGLIVISFIVNHSWISFDVFAFADYGFKFAHTLADYSNLSSWVREISLGFPDVLLWRTPLVLFQSIFGHIGFDLNVADKFSIMWVWMILPVVSSYVFVKRITDSKIGGIVGSLIFCYNTYFISINSAGHFNISIAAAFGLLALYYLIRTYESKHFSNVIFASLSLWATCVYDLRVCYLIIGIYVMYFLYTLLLSGKKRKAVFVGSTKKYFVTLFLFGLLNAYWILPTIVSRSFSESDLLGNVLFGEQFWSIDSAIALFHPFWNGQVPIWFQKNNVPFYFFIIPLLALMGLFFSKKNKRVIFFGLIALLGIFLAKQSDPPFGHVYELLYKHFPGFNAFREATKFYIFIVIGYSVAVGFLYSKVLQLQSKKIIISGLKIFLILLPLIVLIPIIVPVISGKIGSTYISRKVSGESVMANDFINSQDEFFRTLLVPTTSHSWPYTSNHPRISMVNALNGNWKGMYATASGGFSVNDQIEGILNQDFSNELLDQSSIKYIVIPRREEVPSDDFFLFYGKDRDYYLEELNKISYIKKIAVGLKETVIYENVGYRPYIYTTQDKESIKRFVPFRKVQFGKTLISGFKTESLPIKEVVYVNHSEAYNSKWIVMVGDLKMFSYPSVLPNRFHIKNDSGLNGFVIDPNYVKRNIPPENYSVNSDGSISLKVIIFYYPDLFFICGVGISLITLLLIVIKSWRVKDL